MVTSRGQPTAAPAPDSDALTDEELRDRIGARNAESDGDLEQQLRSPLGVILFVGAGMSANVQAVR